MALYGAIYWISPYTALITMMTHETLVNSIKLFNASTFIPSSHFSIASQIFSNVSSIVST